MFLTYVRRCSAELNGKRILMTPEEQLREQRQALNAAINNHDLKTVESFLHPDFIGKGPGGHT